MSQPIKKKLDELEAKYQVERDMLMVAFDKEIAMEKMFTDYKEKREKWFKHNGIVMVHILFDEARAMAPNRFEIKFILQGTSKKYIFEGRKPYNGGDDAVAIRYSEKYLTNNGVTVEEYELPYCISVLFRFLKMEFDKNGFAHLYQYFYFTGMEEKNWNKQFIL